jgi:hypothetical protein
MGKLSSQGHENEIQKGEPYKSGYQWGHDCGGWWMGCWQIDGLYRDFQIR